VSGPRTLAALAGLALAGCAIDGTPIHDKQFYRESLRRIEQAGHQVNKGAGPFSFGTARADITPPVGTPMAGYGGLASRRSTGTHDPLYARALALHDGTDLAVLVGTDLLIIREDLEAEVMRRTRAMGLDLRDEQVMLTATHTHAGPGGYGTLLLEELVMGAYDPGVRDFLAEGIARSILQAARSLQPGTVSFGRTDVPECVDNRVGEKGRVNPRLDVMLCQGRDGRKAWVLNYAAHPTCLGSGNTEFSADFPGVACRELEGDGSFALYTAGTIGGQRPQGNGRKGFDRCEYVGTTLAARARKAMEGAAVKEKVDLRVLDSTFELPPPQVRLTPISNSLRLPTCIGDPLVGKGLTPKIQLLAIDDHVYYGTPSDTGWDVGLALISHAKAEGFDATIVSQCEGYVGYVCREERYWNGKGIHYEGLMSFHGPRMDSYYRDLFDAALGKLK
jgi:hypothetical protein